MADLHHLADTLADGLRDNAVGLVEVVLQLPSALRLVHSGPHRGSNGIGVQDDQTLGVAGGAADGLYQAGLAAKEALLVSVQYGHQRHLRQVQALTQQVDTHQHVELAQTQVADDLHALQGRHVGVHIPHLDTQPAEVGGQVLGHFLGEGGHQHALVPLRPGVYLRHQVVDLTQHRTDLHSGVQQAGRPDDLFHDLVRLLLFKVAGGGGDEHRLGEALLELLELQGAVIKGAGQAEAVVHQALLAGMVAVVHGPHLG